jgi:UDP-GlcNAc:undecaprenyl-phosphate GlcNAc-1-phosphate transferase
VAGAVAFFVAAVVVLAATPLVARVAERLNILDRPGALKVQHQPVPYLGGVAVFLGVACALASTHPLWLIPLALALFLGVADDLNELHPVRRLVCESAIGLAAGVVLAPENPFVVLGTAVAVVVLVNAVNLLDGLDGLASGVGLVSAIGFALVGGPGRVPALALAGALAAFLVYNSPPASIYLGDGGAYVLGAALAMLATAALDQQPHVAYAAAIPLLVAVPIGDTVIAMVRRTRARRPLFEGDRSHVYDQLVDRGRTPKTAAATCVLCQAAFVGLAFALWHLSNSVAIALAAVTVLLVVAAISVFGFIEVKGVE